MIKTWVKFLAGYLAVCIFFSGFALIVGYPWHPISPLGWGIYILLSPPLYLLAEFISSKILSEKISEKIESVKIAPHISDKRMVYVFFVMVCFVVAILFVDYLLPHNFSDFISNNFSDEW